MEGNTRRRRRKDDAPKPTTASRRGERPVGEGEATSTVHDIPDDVLELILLRLDSPVCLVRAASACKRWCRVVADTGFLARFRLLNAPCLVMGHYHNYGSPFFTPSPTPIIPITHSFSLDFIPPAESGGTWEIVDSRDGLLLLFRNKHNYWRIQRHLLVVCEPQTRRYHPISMPEPDDQVCGRAYLGSFLLKGGTASIGMSNFKVILVLLREDLVDRDRGVPGARVYLGSNRSWHDINCAGKVVKVNIPRTTASFHFVGRANGSLYWAVEDTGAALVLDEATAAVSLQALPVTIQYWHEGRCFRVFGGEDGTLRAVRLVEDTLSVFARLKGGAGDMDECTWVLENLVRLPQNTSVGVLGRSLIVAAHDTSVLVAPWHSTWLFSVDLKTMAVEHVRERNKDYLEGPAYPYKLPWPPTLKA